MGFEMTVLPPSPMLAEHVMCYIVRRRSTREGAPEQKVLNHFPANLYSSLTIVHDGRLVDPSGRSHALAVIGLMTVGTTREYVGMPETTVVLLKPGRLTDLCRVPADEMTDRYVDASPVFSRDEQIEITDRMSAQPTVARQIRVLEAVLERRFQATSGSKAVPMSRLLQRLVWRLPYMSVDDMAREADLGSRQLQRQMGNTFGASPKMVIRLARLQLALRELQAGASRPDLSLGRLALACGFADASHMTREFQAMIGNPPSRLLQQMRQSMPSAWAHRLQQDMLNPTDRSEG